MIMLMTLQEYLEEQLDIEINIVDHKDSKLFQTLRWAVKITTFGQIELSKMNWLNLNLQQ